MHCAVAQVGLHVQSDVHMHSSPRPRCSAQINKQAEDAISSLETTRLHFIDQVHIDNMPSIKKNPLQSNDDDHEVRSTPAKSPGTSIPPPLQPPLRQSEGPGPVPPPPPPNLWENSGPPPPPPPPNARWNSFHPTPPPNDGATEANHRHYFPKRNRAPRYRNPVLSDYNLTSSDEWTTDTGESLKSSVGPRFGINYSDTDSDSDGPRWRRYRSLDDKTSKKKKATFKCHSYNIPSGYSSYPRTETHDIWMEFFIRSTDGKGGLAMQGSDSWPWTHMSGIRRTKSEDIHLHNVIAAKAWSDAEGRHRLDLTTTADFKTAETDAAYPFRWLHVQTDTMDSEEFRNIVVNTPNLSRNWKIVAMRLLERIQRNSAAATGRDGNKCTGCVMRADSAELAAKGHNHTRLTAISVDFPFHALGTKSTSHTVGTTHMHQSSLFESAAEDSFEQTFSRMVGDEASEERCISPSHLWCFILDKSMLPAMILKRMRCGADTI